MSYVFALINLDHRLSFEACSEDIVSRVTLLDRVRPAYLMLSFCLPRVPRLDRILIVTRFFAWELGHRESLTLQR